MELTHSYKEAKTLTKHIVLSGRVPFLWGAPGIGKSTIGREVAQELGAELTILDVPLLQPIDYVAAVPNHEEKKVHLYPTGFLPQKGPAVILVEDLPHAKSYQMIPVMQMVLDRRIGHMTFEKDVHFICTGNREEDLAGVNPLPSPLLNRMVHIVVNPSVEEWIEWAREAEVDPRVTGFLQAYPQYMLQMPEDGVKAWATPRSWHMCSDVIKTVNDDSLLRSLVTATVGPKITSVFMAWVKYLQEINPADILERGILPSVDQRPQYFAIIQAVVAKMMDRKDVHGYIKKNVANIKKFFTFLPGEFKSLFLKELALYRTSARKANIVILQTLFELCPEMANYSESILNNLNGGK